jgi:hypothetical protein
MTEPVYIAQNGELTDRKRIHEWFRDRAREATDAHGCKWFRYSESTEFPHLFLVEGWSERPKGWEFGEPRWQLTASKPAEAA